MSRFREELRIIPRAVWIVGVVLGVAAIAGMATILAMSRDPEIRRLPVSVLLPLFGAVVVFVYVLTIGYVYSDAKRRQMHYVMWTLLAVCIPHGIGIILYFILRDPLPKICPGCAKHLKAGFVFCPFCGMALQVTCPKCEHGVEVGWANCPHCGAKLPSPAVQTA